MQVVVDREKAGELGISTGQWGQQLRNAIFGTKAGVYKEDGEDYDIYVRFDEESRYNERTLRACNKKRTQKKTNKAQVQKQRPYQHHHGTFATERQGTLQGIRIKAAITTNIRQQ